MALSTKIAVNPLPWVLTPDGFDLSVAKLSQAFPAIAGAGFGAVHADIPKGMSVADYQSLLADYGLAAAPGYFAAHFDTDEDEFAQTIEAAKVHAANQAKLGLTEVFLASHLNPIRLARPAVGAGYDPAVLDLVISRIARTAAAITGEGVTPCFHPHVGSWIETEFEVRALLDQVDATEMSFGPDTGHLFWAGADPAGLIGDYSDRVGAMHLKDVHRSAANRVEKNQDDYRTATFGNHVWTEPGRGDVDLTSALAALPSSYAGWFVLEVDVPDFGDAEQSTLESARWVAWQRAGQTATA